MTRFGFHASHEQTSPRQLMTDVQHAESAGFAMAMCSDHFRRPGRAVGLPRQQPKLLAPVVSVESAARVAAWADGLITVLQPLDDLRRVVDAYRGAGGRGDVSLQPHLSWAPTAAEADAIAHDQWRSNVFGAPGLVGHHDSRA